jgi:hypothetical protein
MKRIFSFISVFALLLTACEGDPGTPGFNGQNGVNFVGQSFETDPLDFFAENGYEQVVDFPVNIEILEGDMILVYLLWSQNPDTWRLLPQIIYTDNGQFQYNFQDNFDNVSIFLDAPSNFDFNSLQPNDTLNQTFRIVVLPIAFINSSDLDVNNFNEVMKFIP